MSAAGTPTIDTDADFKKGKEALGNKEYSVAAELFSATLERFVECYGQLGSECGEVYYQYGLALFRELEQSEENQDVFGPKVPKEIPTGREDEGGNDDAKDSESSKTPAVGEDSAGRDKEAEVKAEAENKEAEDGEGKDESEESSEEDDEGEEGNGGEAEGAGKNEAEAAQDAEQKEGSADGVEDPLQLAWEVLDTARNIFKDDESKELRLADTLLLLGDVNLRNEMFELATQDYEQCLSLRERLLKPDDRLLMEVHHQIAIARLYFPVPDKVGALKALRSAVKVCEIRLENLNKAMNSDSGPDPNNSSVQVKSRGELEEEITEFEEIKEELLARIESEETVSDLPEGAQPCSSTSAGPSSVSDSLGAGNLSSLMAQAGIPSSSVGFGTAGGAASSSPVKVLGVFGKRKAQSAADGSSSAPAADSENNKKARLDSAPKVAEDISAAPTPSTQSPPKADAQ